MDLFELTIKDEDIDEIFAISLVESGAIESDFVFFNKQEQFFKQVNKEQRLIMGPVLIPDKKILRVDGQGQPYQVFFSKETVKKLAQNYLKKKYNDQVTLEHDKKVKGVYLVESWIKESKMDKSNSYGLKLPVGSWVGLFKVDNDEIWNEYVKTGKVKGWSIEGVFEHEFVKKNEDFYDVELMNILEQEADFLLSKIRATIKKDKRYKSKKRIDMESYSDYPQGVRNNAKKGIELNEKQNNKCATQVGKVRAKQLQKGEPISVETIKRMYSYLSRSEEYYDPNSTTECGTISYLLWGGLAAKNWSRNKLRELGLLEENQQPSISSSYPGEGPTSGSYISEETLQDTEMDILGYQTDHFYICPGAKSTFEDILTHEIDEETAGMIRSAALQADKVFKIEADVVNSNSATQSQLNQASILVGDFKDLIKEIYEEFEKPSPNVSYMDGHIEVIKQYVENG